LRTSEKNREKRKKESERKNEGGLARSQLPRAWNRLSEAAHLLRFLFTIDEGKASERYRLEFLIA